MSDQASQDEEIESLQSIFLPDELKIRKTERGLWQVMLNVAVEIPENYQIVCRTSPTEKPVEILRVNHLPPIILKATFRNGYPSFEPPFFDLKCQWFLKRHEQKLASKLIKLWKSNCGLPIVYTWLQHLQCETLKILGVQDKLDVTGLTQMNNDKKTPALSSCSSSNFHRNKKKRREPVRRHIIETIDSHNKEKQYFLFLKRYHTCEICFSEKLGQHSMLFEACRHLFCRECLKNYFTVLINEGSSCAVKCPAYKCDTEVRQNQIRELLSPELFEKYDKALLSTMLDTMSDIVYCPRPLCQYPVTWQAGDRLAMCPSCNYAFCIYCRMVYHGIEPCKYNADERKKLVESYVSGSLDEKRDLELRYGKKQLEGLVSNTLSEYWIKDNGKKCPKCNVVIEKSEGCNKMTCNKCQAFFCWLCNHLLDPKFPYLHYSDPKSPCNNKLFQFEPEEEAAEGDWEWWDEWADDQQDSGPEDIEADDTDTDSDL